MDIGPRRRVVQKILSECLSRIRLFGHCSEEEFAERIRDLTALLHEWAEQLEAPSPDVDRRPEPKAFRAYALWAESYDQSEDNPVIAGEEEVIWDMIGNVQGLRVLDVGCGTGRHALPMAANGAQVVGLDPTPEMLYRAWQKAQTKGLNVDLREGSIDALDVRLGEFDLVLCCLVLSHVADLAGAIVKLASHIRPGGRLIVSDFHPSNILLGFRTSCSKGDQKYVIPNYLHLPSDYFNAISIAGLKVAQFFEKGHIAKFPGLPMTLIMEAQSPDHK